MLSEKQAKARIAEPPTSFEPMRVQHVSDFVRFLACKKYTASDGPVGGDILTVVDDWSASVFDITLQSSNVASAVGDPLGTASAVGDPLGAGSQVDPSRAETSKLAVRKGAWVIDLDAIIVRPLRMKLRPHLCDDTRSNQPSLRSFRTQANDGSSAKARGAGVASATRVLPRRQRRPPADRGVHIREDPPQCGLALSHRDGEDH